MLCSQTEKKYFLNAVSGHRMWQNDYIGAQVVALGYKLLSSTIAEESTAKTASKVKRTQNMSNGRLGKNFSIK